MSKQNKLMQSRDSRLHMQNQELNVHNLQFIQVSPVYTFLSTAPMHTEYCQGINRLGSHFRKYLLIIKSGKHRS